jgi:hypothetical protein
MEAIARNLLESYCPAYAGLWSHTVPLFLNANYPTQQAKDGAITGLICNIMNPTDVTGCGVFRTAYMRKRCLVLASVAYPDMFHQAMYERYAEYCTEEYKANAHLQVHNLQLKADIKAKKEEVKKLLAEHKKAVRMMKKRGVEIE